MDHTLRPLVRVQRNDIIIVTALRHTPRRQILTQSEPAATGNCAVGWIASSYVTQLLQGWPYGMKYLKGRCFPLTLPRPDVPHNVLQSDILFCSHDHSRTRAPDSAPRYKPLRQSHLYHHHATRTRVATGAEFERPAVSPTPFRRSDSR